MTCRVARLSQPSCDAAKPAAPVDANSSPHGSDGPDALGASTHRPTPARGDLETARSA